MLALKYSINYRNITLTNESSELVGVYEKSGRITQLRFLGFIPLGSARWLGKRVKPVRLAVERYSSEGRDGLYNWVELSEGEYIQGCIFDNGVFAVIQGGKPRVVIKD